jgi:hypothetical protein
MAVKYNVDFIIINKLRNIIREVTIIRTEVK